MRNAILGFVLAIMLLLPVQAQEPVVYGLFFYSPTCPHCHEVINNHWPAIQAEFGDQLQVLFIDVTVAEGSQIMQTTRAAMGIQSSGVPMLIIGDTVLIGSIDIPQRTPALVRQGLAQGGIGYPLVPGIEALFEATMASAEQPSEADTFTLSERVLSDPAGSAAAMLVLVGLVVSAVLVLIGSGQTLTGKVTPLVEALDGIIGWWVLIATGLAGFMLALSLTLSGGWIALLAGVIGIAFVVLLVTIGQQGALHQVPQWALALVILMGLIIAGYLTYIETTASDAVCGVVGDCNAVQQSPYARISGIPVGALGIAGYGLLLLIWLAGRFGGFKGADRLLLLLAAGGVLFSIYLTFLEPFVIGAVCAWCLTSAVTMLMLLWLTAASAWQTWRAKSPKQAAS